MGEDITEEELGGIEFENWLYGSQGEITEDCQINFLYADNNIQFGYYRVSRPYISLTKSPNISQINMLPVCKIPRILYQLISSGVAEDVNFMQPLNNIPSCFISNNVTKWKIPTSLEKIYIQITKNDSHFPEWQIFKYNTQPLSKPFYVTKNNFMINFIAILSILDENKLKEYKVLGST